LNWSNDGDENERICRQSIKIIILIKIIFREGILFLFNKVISVLYHSTLNHRFLGAEWSPKTSAK
jgi:hypothetical protein